MPEFFFLPEVRRLHKVKTVFRHILSKMSDNFWTNNLPDRGVVQFDRLHLH